MISQHFSKAKSLESLQGYLDMSQGMDDYGDGYEVVLENNPSMAEVNKQQSLNMSNIK
jgi:hypothetical protein